MAEILYVYINNNYIGVLENTLKGGLNFQYDENAKQRLSLSLPIQKNVYQDKECHGFFNGLLPETDESRRQIAEKYGIKNPNNDFEILRAIGYDCPGAIAFSEIKNDKNLKASYEINCKKISEEDLEKFIKELPQKPLGTGNNLRLSLAGAQDKTGVLLLDNEVVLSDNITPSTHILKPAIKELKNSVENEYICMKTAEKLGIRVPKVEIRKANKTEYFLIERFDRIFDNNFVKRVHQEDFCQAKNIASAFKYEVNKGVGYRSCFEILNQTTKPALAIKHFVERMVFNYLIMNNDAHGKNFSLLYREDGEIELAPAYDILCTKVYKKLDYKMAMAIGGKYPCQEIQPSDFETFAKEVGINYNQLSRIIKEQCYTIPELMSEVVSSFENKIGQSILCEVEKNCLKNIKRFRF